MSTTIGAVNDMEFALTLAAAILGKDSVAVVSPSEVMEAADITGGLFPVERKFAPSVPAGGVWANTAR